MTPILTPDDAAFDELCRELSERANALDESGAWPHEQLSRCREYGVFRWFAPSEWHGVGWSDADLLRGYARLAACCMSTTFALTQPHGVIRRLVDGDNEPLKSHLLGELVAGERFASVGISHLTTSRRHLNKPAMTARETGDAFTIDGLCPWVTGGVQADYVVTGAQLNDGRQLLIVLPTDSPGVSFDPPAEMVGLTATQTGSMRCRGVRVEPLWILAGPCENVLATQRGGKTGGLQTSALACGLADAAIAYLETEAAVRDDLRDVAQVLRDEQVRLLIDLINTAEGIGPCGNDDLRSRANLLVLRATQSALTAAKGTGYLKGHAVGRWCREALFFLVWSCPQPVASATLCELAGLG